MTLPRLRVWLVTLAAVMTLSGCEMLELAGRAPAPDATLPDCIADGGCS